MNKLLILVATLVLGLVLMGAASATTSPAPANPDAIITTDASVSGHNVVYSKRYTDTDYDIYITNMRTGTSKIVSMSVYNERNPDISGNIVVWQSKPTSGNWQIYWDDLSTTNGPAMIFPESGKDQTNPSISGTKVVWQQYYCPGSASNGDKDDYNIVGYDLATGTYYGNIASSHLYQGSPDICGNTVVYQQYMNIGSTSSLVWRYQVYKTTFSSINKGTKIYSSSRNQVYPVVSSTGKAAWQEKDTDDNVYVVWVSNVLSATSKNSIYRNGYDLNDYHSIYGNYVVFTSDDNDDIYMQHLTSVSSKILVHNNLISQYSNAIGGDGYGIFVAYTDAKDGYDRVYWRNMDSTKPTVKSSSPTNGATKVSTTKTITITFSEYIKAGTNFWVELKTSAGTPVSITKSISGKVLTIKHAKLAANKTFKIILHTGCITDYANNKLAAKTLTFTTGSS